MGWFVRYIDDELKHEMVSRELATEEEALEEAWNLAQGDNEVIGIDGPDGYVFFVVDSRHPAYELVQNVVAGQMYVREFVLHDYPLTADHVLPTGPAALDAALHPVHIRQVNPRFRPVGRPRPLRVAA